MAQNPEAASTPISAITTRGSEGSAVPEWQAVADGLPPWRRNVADRVFRPLLGKALNTIATRDTSALASQSSSEPVRQGEQQGAEATARLGQLLDEYQGSGHRRVSKDLARVVTHPSTLDEDTRSDLDREKDEIYEHIADMSPRKLNRLQRQLARAERHALKNMPENQPDLLGESVTPLPFWQETDATLSDTRRTIAEMNFASTLIGTLLTESKKHVPRRPLRERITHKPLLDREELAVKEDLEGLLVAYEKFQRGVVPEPNTEAFNYFARIRKLAPGLNEKRNNIYLIAAKVPDEDVKDFEDSAKRGTELLVGRRLHGTQRDLAAERIPNLEVKDVVKAYKDAIKKNAKWFIGENFAALGAGIAFKYGVDISSGGLLTGSTSASELLMDGTIGASGISIAKLIAETGTSIDIAALLMYNMIAGRTENEFLRGSGAVGGRVVTQGVAEKLLWGGGFAAATASGLINVRDVLLIALGANLLGITWQGLTWGRTRFMRRGARKEREHEGLIREDATDLEGQPEVAGAPGSTDGSQMTRADEPQSGLDVLGDMFAAQRGDTSAATEDTGVVETTQ